MITGRRLSWFCFVSAGRWLTARKEVWTAVYCCIKWPPIAEAQKDKACFFPAAQLKSYWLTFATLLMSSEFKDSRICCTLSSDNNIQLHGGKQTEKFLFFRDKHFSVLAPLFCFGVCAVYFSPFVLLSLPAPLPLTLCCVHTLFQPPLWLAWPRSADSAGTGNTLTLCPVLSSPSKGQSKWDLQLHLKQSRYRREGQQLHTVVPPLPPGVFFLKHIKCMARVRWNFL